MKLIFKTTGVTKVTDERQLVQLQGETGHASLNLPLSVSVTIGDEFLLERHPQSALGHVGDVDETRDPYAPSLQKLITPLMPSSNLTATAR